MNDLDLNKLHELYVWAVANDCPATAEVAFNLMVAKIKERTAGAA